jgi:hypothetical protein
VVFNSFGKYKPIFINGSRVFAYKNCKIFYSDYNKDKFFKEICTLPVSMSLKILSRFRILERLFRLEPRAAYLSTDNSLLFSFYGSIFNVGLNNGIVNQEHSFRCGMNNPLSFCEIRNINGFDDCEVYGEYWGNQKKEPVAIYKRNVNKKEWGKIYEFPKNTVTHIHSIVPDKFNNRVLILTGDDDIGSGFWVATDNFEKVSPFMIGKQSYRACAAFPTEKGILFATDNPFEENYIGLIEETNNGCRIKNLFPIEGPCIFYCTIANFYCFATSVEPDQINMSNRYYFTYKLGQGVKSRNATIVMGNFETGFKVIKKFKKDFLPITLFQFGNIWFPAGSAADKLIIYPQSTSKNEGEMLIIDLNQITN